MTKIHLPEALRTPASMLAVAITVLAALSGYGHGAVLDLDPYLEAPVANGVLGQSLGEAYARLWWLVPLLSGLCAAALLLLVDRLSWLAHGTRGRTAGALVAVGFTCLPGALGLFRVRGGEVLALGLALLALALVLALGGRTQRFFGAGIFGLAALVHPQMAGLTPVVAAFAWFGVSRSPSSAQGVGRRPWLAALPMVGAGLTALVALKIAGEWPAEPVSEVLEGQRWRLAIETWAAAPAMLIDTDLWAVVTTGWFALAGKLPIAWGLFGWGLLALTVLLGGPRVLGLFALLAGLGAVSVTPWLVTGHIPGERMDALAALLPLMALCGAALARGRDPLWRLTLLGSAIGVALVTVLIVHHDEDGRRLERLSGRQYVLQMPVRYLGARPVSAPEEVLDPVRLVLSGLDIETAFPTERHHVGLARDWGRKRLLEHPEWVLDAPRLRSLFDSLDTPAPRVRVPDTARGLDADIFERVVASDLERRVGTALTKLRAPLEQWWPAVAEEAVQQILPDGAEVLLSPVEHPRLLRLEADLRLLLVTLGDRAGQLGDPVRAVALYGPALSGYEPGTADHAVIATRLGIMQVRAGLEDEGLALIEEHLPRLSIEREERHVANFVRGRLLAERGQDDAALTCLEAVLRVQASDGSSDPLGRLVPNDENFWVILETLLLRTQLAERLGPDSFRRECRLAFDAAWKRVGEDGVVRLPELLLRARRAALYGQDEQEREALEALAALPISEARERIGEGAPLDHPRWRRAGLDRLEQLLDAESSPSSEAVRLRERIAELRLRL